ncbi:MAG: tail fiber domain-containing protein [Curtobacterium sp.]
MSGTRVAGWWESATGRAGTASSSRRFKQDIEPANMDVNAILAIEVVHYHYIAEIRKRDDPTFEDYVGPEYKVATEVGVIAEQLHDLGLWQFVVYQRENYTETRTRPVTLTQPVLNADTNEPVLDDFGEPLMESYEGEEEYTLYLDRLKLNDAGQPIPDGVHYELLALATIPVLQDHERRIAALERATPTPTPDTNQET